jgi:hypothetical protein
MGWDTSGLLLLPLQPQPPTTHQPPPLKPHRNRLDRQSTASSAGPSAPRRGFANRAACPAPTGSEFTPVESRNPQLSPQCLAALSAAITEDGLVQAPAGGWGSPDGQGDRTAGGGDSAPGTPAGSGGAGGVLAGLGGGRGGGALGEHVRLVRGERFRVFVLTAAANLLEATQRDAAGAALLGGCGGGGGGGGGDGAGWLALCGPLYKLAKMILDSATPGGRHVGGGAASAKGKTAKAGAGGAMGGGSAASGGDGGGEGGGGDTLELMAARALHQAVALADVTQQLPRLARALVPAPAGGGGDLGDQGAGDDECEEAPPGSEDQGTAATGGSAGQQAGTQRGGRQQARQAGGDASEAALARALAPLLPQLQASVDSLLRAGCFKAAQVLVQTLLLLGRRLAGAEAALAAAAGQAAPAHPPQRGAAGQQQQQIAAAAAAAEPARAAVQSLSAWARGACQQTEPEVTHLPLVKGLLEAVVRFSSEWRGGRGRGGAVGG